MNVQLIADTACKVGEGPLWHAEERRLYWIDIPNGDLFRYDPNQDVHDQVWSGPLVGGFTIQADGTLLFFYGGGPHRSMGRRRYGDNPQ